MQFYPPPFINLMISMDCKFHGDIKYTNEDISKKLDELIEKYEKCSVKCPETDKLKKYYGKFKESLIESIVDGLKLIDRNHASYMMVVVKHFRIRLIRCTDWMINEEEKPIIKPGTWGF